MQAFVVATLCGALLAPRLATSLRPRVFFPRVSIPVLATAAPGPKEELLSLSATSLQQPVDEATRSLVNELILELERAAPTPAPAMSPLLNGVWQLRLAGGLGKGFVDSPTRELALTLYATAYAPGTFLQLLGKLPSQLGVSLGEITVQIRAAEAGQPRVTTTSTAAAFGSTQELRFYSNLQPMSGTRLREDVVEAEVLGQRVPLAGPLARSRTLFVTYLDADLLIARDESGTPEVLARKQDMRFSSSSEQSKKGFGDEPLPADGTPAYEEGDEPSDI